LITSFFLSFHRFDRFSIKIITDLLQSVAHIFLSYSMGKNEKTEVGDKDGEGVNIGSGLFLTPSPTGPPYANFTSAKNDLQY